MNFSLLKLNCVRTDNGLEFTNRLVSDVPSLFEIYLKQCNINHNLIKPYTPKHNGNVERDGTIKTTEIDSKGKKTTTYTSSDKTVSTSNNNSSFLLFFLYPFFLLLFFPLILHIL